MVNKKIIFLFALGMFSVLLLNTTISAQVSVNDCQSLQDIKNFPNQDYILINNIDCSITNPSNSNNPGSMWDNGGLGFEPIGKSNHFTGIFNGQGYNISNLYIHRSSEINVGLFSSINGAEIKNLGLINVNMNGKGNLGGLAGSSFQSDILNSYSTGTIGGTTYKGGLVGYSSGVCTSSYWDTTTSGSIVSSCGAGKTTAEMQAQVTFVGWDFVNIWDINEGISYPFLV